MKSVDKRDFYFSMVLVGVLDQAGQDARTGPAHASPKPQPTMESPMRQLNETELLAVSGGDCPPWPTPDIPMPETEVPLPEPDWPDPPEPEPLPLPEPPKPPDDEDD